MAVAPLYADETDAADPMRLMFLWAAAVRDTDVDRGVVSLVV